MSSPVNKTSLPKFGFLVVVVVVSIGGLCGAMVFGVYAIIGQAVGQLAPQSEFEYLAIYSPLPHHVPEHPGGLSLRFAMVHDVIHEHFVRHSDAYYKQRNLQTRAELEKLSKDDPARWPLVDDLCVGLERLGETDKAIPLMQEKLDQQRAAGLKGIDLYTSLANLGTFLIHANFAAARDGDEKSLKRFQEGVGLVRQATEVNPGAHFGRERWQLVIGEFLLDAFQHPDRLRESDFIGNPLNETYDDIMDSERTYYTGFGKASRALHSRSAQYDYPDFFPPQFDLNDPAHWDELKGIREYITKVGPEEEGVPFDEPVLGVIGMWREGGGANPHFSLALGETMLRVGQRYIAWTAYERTKQLAARYSPDPELQEFLRAHCENRQTEIEDSFETFGDVLSPEIHPEYSEEESIRINTVNPEQLRNQFEKELSHGQVSQHDYQRFEAEQISKGVSIDDPDFYTPFYSTHPSIATTPGQEEMMYYVPVSRRNEFFERRFRNFTFFGASLGAFLMSLAICISSDLLRSRRLVRLKSRREAVTRKCQKSNQNPGN